MDDLIQRLRKGVRRLDQSAQDNNAAERNLAIEAANEIERLRRSMDGKAMLTTEMIEAGSEAIDPFVGCGADCGGHDSIKISRLVLESALEGVSDEIERLRRGINDAAQSAEQLAARTGVEGFTRLARQLRGLKD